MYIINAPMARSLAVSIGVAVLVASAAAHAKPRVAVVPFEGDDDGTVQEVVADLLDDDFSVEGSRTVSRTVDKLDLGSNLSEKDLEKLANELDLDAILRGDLRKKGRRHLLHLMLFVNGKKVRGFKVEFASAESEKFQSALKDKLEEKLADADRRSRDDEGDDDSRRDRDIAKSDDSGDEERRRDRDDEDERSDRDEDRSDRDEDDDDRGRKRTASADVDDEDIGVSASASVGGSGKSRAANTVAVRLDVGPSVSSRTLKFNSRAFEEAPKPYKNSPVGGMRVAGELYPLAFGNPHSFISGLGIAGQYDQTFKLNLQSTAQPGTKFPVTQRHWNIGLRFRIAFGRSARAPTMTLGGGYFHRTFKVDRTLLMDGNIIDIPDVLYAGYDPGLEFRIPIIKQVALVFGGQAVLVTSTGQIQKPTSYGRAKVTGGQGMAALDIVIANRVALRLSGEVAQFGFAFVGNGAMTYNRDNDPMTPDVGGASDRYYGGAATLGVLY